MNEKSVSPTSNELTQDPLEGHTAFELRCAKAEIGRLRAVLERAERVSAMVNALPVTTEELRRIRNAGKITWDKMVNLLTSCLIDMREASTSSPSETFGKLEPRSDEQAALLDRAYIEGAEQAQAIAHQSLIALDKWIADGCGNRRSPSKASERPISRYAQPRSDPPDTDTAA